MTRIKIGEWELEDDWKDDTGTTCLEISASHHGSPVPLEAVPEQVLDDAVSFFVSGSS